MTLYTPKTSQQDSTSFHAALFPHPLHARNLERQICSHSTDRSWQVNMVIKATKMKPIIANRSQPSGNFTEAVSAVVWNDLRAEFRSRELFSAMMVFSLLIILIFNFALELDFKIRLSVSAVLLL